MELLGQVKRTILQHPMINRGDRIIAAVSGGPDSVCLLHVLDRLRDELAIHLAVAHFDHGLRPEADQAETDFVGALASRMNLPFHTRKGRLLHARSPGQSLEEQAREARYGFLLGLLNESDASRIATGHTLSDQAETVLMRILRGSGPTGLGGIPPVREGKIIRPLLGIKRADILSYLEERGLAYVTDGSNRDTRYLRNRIRHDLLPELLTYQPRLVEHLGQLARLMNEEDGYMLSVARDWVDGEALVLPPGHLTVPLKAFNRIAPPLRRRIIRVLLHRVKGNLRRITRRHIEAGVRLALSTEPQGNLDLPGGLSIRKRYDRLIVTTRPVEGARPFHHTLPGPGTYRLKDIPLTLRLEEMDKATGRDLQGPPMTAMLDADTVPFPLTLRNIEPGDRFIPLGMRGHRKVKDFFIDLKVPSEVRARTPLLLSLGRPVWVCGFRIDDRARVSSGTSRVLRADILEGPPGPIHRPPRPG